MIGNNSSDDPFFSLAADTDRTVIRPVPGGRVQDIPRGIPNASTPFIQAIPLEHLGKLNPLENAASTLLDLAANLYGRPSHPTPQQLRQQLSAETRNFHQHAAQAGIDRQMIQQASHALCTTLDEAVFNTPWGQQAGWAEHSLLSEFHDSVAGGEEFFQNLRHLGDNPTQNLYLLELMYLCLGFGFQGRYRMVADGKTKLEQIQTWLVNLIRQQRGNTDKALSPHWVGVETQTRRRKRLIPFWAFYALAAALAVAMFFGFLMSLTVYASPIKQKINEIAFAPPVTTQAARTPVAPSLLASLKQAFAPEIQDKLLLVGIKNGKPFIQLRGEQGLFQSGSELLLVQREELVSKIAEVLVEPVFAKANLTVVGYTDNIPPSSRIRFNDNFDLSKARAEYVRDLLLKHQASLKASVLGKGAMDAVGDNKTPEGRASNRRVEIILN